MKKKAAIERTISMVSPRIGYATRLPAYGVSSSLLEDLKTGFDIKRRVRVLLSGEVRIPFACYTARPTVVLPMEAVRWSKGRIRAVLTHELAHVKRFDFLTRAISRIVCSLFRLAPFV